MDGYDDDTGKDNQGCNITVGGNRMSKQSLIEIVCPNCGYKGHLKRGKLGRGIGATAGAVVGGIAGFFIGASLGIASGGVAIAATIPLTIMGASMGGGGGYFVGSMGDKIRCPKCKQVFSM